MIILITDINIVAFLIKVTAGIFIISMWLVELYNTCLCLRPRNRKKRLQLNWFECMWVGDKIVFWLCLMESSFCLSWVVIITVLWISVRGPESVDCVYLCWVSSLRSPWPLSTFSPCFQSGKLTPLDHRKVPVLSGFGLGQANGGLGRKTERREEVRSGSMSPGSLFARSLPSDWRSSLYSRHLTLQTRAPECCAVHFELPVPIYL